MVTMITHVGIMIIVAIKKDRLPCWYRIFIDIFILREEIIRSDEGVTLETFALKLYGGQFKLWTQLIIPNYFNQNTV